MLSKILLRTALGIAAVSCVLLGAGCIKKTAEQQSLEVQDQMRQPPQATAPTKEPTIPPEAAKVPRPY
ncbi:MAG: hypothetical protein WC787_00555 [Patescibacteria group bacterium]